MNDAQTKKPQVIPDGYFLNVVNYKLGTTGNEFVADEVFTGKPQYHHNILVFDGDAPK